MCEKIRGKNTTKKTVQGSSHPPKLTIRTQCGKFPVTCWLARNISL